jgi:hypothetical protein
LSAPRLDELPRIRCGIAEHNAWCEALNLFAMGRLRRHERVNMRIKRTLTVVFLSQRLA